MATLITDAELLSLGIASDALGAIPSGDRDAQRLAASSFVLSYLANRYSLPLVSWTDDVKAATAHIAAWWLLSRRGYDSTSGSDDNIENRYNAALVWLADVRDGRAFPEEVIDSGSVDERGVLIGEPSRPWRYPTGAE